MGEYADRFDADTRLFDQDYERFKVRFRAMADQAVAGARKRNTMDLRTRCDAAYLAAVTSIATAPTNEAALAATAEAAAAVTILDASVTALGDEDDLLEVMELVSKAEAIAYRRHKGKGPAEEELS